ncbi:MAG: asparagine synthase (glutamine-hydrolyzing), partial [Spirochaetota bacterium]|nr:asparagine synthase (glutamine-hydrolyzing) [Spirochaetota bacterium]
MCGIVGFTNQKSRLDRERVLKDMADSIRHRGPDDEGYHITSQISLGHRRLSIIDIHSGHQPMFDEDRSVSIVFNGEIYNFPDLKTELEAKGHLFTTHSDTEVLVHLYEEYGLDMFEHLNGMFAFALWDEKAESLLLARDRAGKKPLYYAEIGGELVFASELKALTRYPGFRREIDPIALQKYLAHEYVPTPHTIFRGVKKLFAGSYLTYKRETLTERQYWDFDLSGSYSNQLSERELIEELDCLMRDSVSRRLISDVPLGVFLSGGIDSSCLVAYMADLMPSKDIKTFSVGFEDKSFDESEYAKDVADYYQTSHHQQVLHPQTLVDILPEVTAFVDEPFADASIVPTYLLSKFTRETVTVALGGDGGDELFMGYPTFQANKMAKAYSWMPSPLHNGIIRPLAEKIPVSMNNLSLDFKIKRFLSAVKADRAYREQLWLGAFSLQDMNELILPEHMALSDNDSLFSESISYNERKNEDHYLDRLSYWYLKTYLHDDILVKVDRASMAVSLECRAPFLDVSVMDFVGRIPHKYKLKGFTMKHILKKLLASKLPKHIIDRPKKGFGIPVARWFREDLRDMVLDVFAEDKIKREGYFS